MTGRPQPDLPIMLPTTSGMPSGVGDAEKSARRGSQARVEPGRGREGPRWAPPK
eukprot:CAMPEP_0204565960 /NCGR_PEP_ID=MMETSP0661-20131031/35782_1 /ASSEMBLY_ACC=CAM_ASM_000606 /TAXON_ID=109239 /ORGANISM="Alexandrium margalefi, Strain AMGDE01CS-322" /LENGTH=53 /DNA_ID=CAMNT_0051573765 /DNA_START=66 /DNA_END=224 /DNA_ORIENTATION=-